MTDSGKIVFPVCQFPFGLSHALPIMTEQCSTLGMKWAVLEIKGEFY